VKLIIVDDDIDLLEMVTLVLTTHGMQIKSLSDGKLLFDTVALERPDMILLDIYLGDTDGRSLCRQLKNTEEFSDIPVLLYSAGNISKASLTDSLADDFVQKPFDLTGLVNRIRHNVRKTN
jgi:DNA-binding response OmpR family regulator